jgi:uncharacterized protein (DUF1684 family)
LNFQINGTMLHLPAYENGKDLFIMFLDQTSSKLSYGGGRYLEAPLPSEGKTTLDFNNAYNPYCAYSHFSSCGVTPRENRVAIQILAGASYKNASADEP